MNGDGKAVDQPVGRREEMEHVPSTVFIAAGAIGAALIAAFASFISLINQKEQKTSEFRQHWIDSLRSELSRLLGEVETVALRARAYMEAEEQDRERFLSDVASQYSAVNSTLEQIRLRLNPNEHGQLESLLCQIRDALHASPIDLGALRSLREEVVSHSRAILKGEWGRVKSGETPYRVTKYGTLFATLVFVATLTWLIARASS